MGYLDYFGFFCPFFGQFGLLDGASREFLVSLGFLGIQKTPTIAKSPMQVYRMIPAYMFDTISVYISVEKYI